MNNGKLNPKNIYKNEIYHDKLGSSPKSKIGVLQKNKLISNQKSISIIIISIEQKSFHNFNKRRKGCYQNPAHFYNKNTQQT